MSDKTLNKYDEAPVPDEYFPVDHPAPNSAMNDKRPNNTIRFLKLALALLVLIPIGAGGLFLCGAIIVEAVKEAWPFIVLVVLFVLVCMAVSWAMRTVKEFYHDWRVARNRRLRLK